MVLLDDGSLTPVFFFKQMHEVAEGFKPKQQHSIEQTVELFFHMMPSAAYA